MSLIDSEGAPSDDDIDHLSRVSQDLASYAGQLLDWAHHNSKPSATDKPSNSPAFLIDALVDTYSGHRFTPSSVPDFARAMPADLESMAGASDISYHGLAWTIAENLLRAVADAVGSHALVGWVPEKELTVVRMPP